MKTIKTIDEFYVVWRHELKTSKPKRFLRYERYRLKS